MNAHLDRLEAAGLLRWVPRLHPVTKRQMPTRNILAFEPGFTPDDPRPCPETGHGIAGRAVSGFCPDPCPENGQSRVRNPDTNPVREPLSKPVKEEEGARARDAIPDRFFEALLRALGFDPDAALPGWWQGGPARMHVRRWIDDLGLTEDRILEVATETRRDHPEPPDGPKALDRAMQRAAQRGAQAGTDTATKASASGRGDTWRRKRDEGPPPSADELAAFYADLVNSDRFLPPTTISTTAMLARGLVTPERLRMRGVR